MKKKLSLLIIFVLAIMLVGCSGGEKKKVESTVDNFMTATKAFDVAKMSSYMIDSDMGDLEDEDVQTFIEIFKAANSKLQYKITSTEVTDTTATVKMNVTYADSTSAVTELVNSIMGLAMTGVTPTEEEISLLMADVKIGDETLTKDITITLEKVDGEWKIDGENEDLMNICTADFIKNMTAMTGQ